ncbi:hypothetical protein HK096_005232 [Nowakowskiella sp. JEL0078]|nr:hypothetical protein HK096_005232 [Nowakowskiella sp. JEL0078]
MMKSGASFPLDYEFEQKASTGAISPKKTSSFAKTMTQSPKSTGMDDGIEDAIVSIPGTKGKKKAQERIKVIEKEIVLIDKKIQGLESMKAHKKSKSSPDPEPIDLELQEQQKKQLYKRDALFLKRYKLQLFISSVDGSPQPEMPSLALADELSPISESSPMSAGSISSSIRTPTQRAYTITASIIEPEWDNPTRDWAGSSVISRPPAPPPPPPPVAPPMPFSMKRNVARAKVLYDFEAQPDTEEVDVRVGDIIEVLEKQEDG